MIIGTDKLRRFLRRRGLDIVRISAAPGQAPPLVEHLVDQLLARGEAELAAYPVPVEQLTWDNGFSLHPDGWNPFLQSAREYLSGRQTQYAGSALERFYRLYAPETAAAYLCPELPAGGPLSALQAAAYIHPWSLRSPAQRLKERRRQNRAEERQLGPGNRASGLNRMGPVSPEKGRIEFTRLTRLADSIGRRGYDRTLVRDVEVAALRRDGQMRYVIVSGYHRAAVLAALGWTQIPVLLKPRQILDETLLQNAPALRSGYWNGAELAAYLDYLFSENGTGRASELGVL